MTPQPDRASQQAFRRKDIQALRFLAVTLVVLFHAGVPGLHGGFVGVDIFFVISGFLIIGGILRSLESGSFSATDFFVRRFTRLLPASTVALGATATALTLLDPLSRRESLLDIGSAAAYVANFRFMFADTGYFANEQPSPVIHYWSLSVEEQFYILTPLGAILCLWLFRNPNRAFAILLATLTLASLGLSIWLTERSPNAAYYFLGTRMWELGLGGMLHLLKVPAIGKWTGRLAGMTGFVMILSSAAFYSEGTPFPGWTALLPVIGTCLIILVGTHGHWQPSSMRVMGARPVQHTGDLSYSWYLWHWPIIILLPTAFGSHQPWVMSLAVILSWVIAHFSFVFVERPATNWARQHRQRPSGAKRLIAIGVATSAAVSLAGIASAAVVPLTSGETATPSKSPMMKTPNIVPANISSPLNAPPKADIYSPICHELTDFDVPDSCVRGDPHGGSTWVLAGDSHAAQWTPAIDQWAKDREIQLIVLYKNGCPAVPLEIATDTTGRDFGGCAAWQQELQKSLNKADVDGVILGTFLKSYVKRLSANGSGVDEAYRSGIDELTADIHVPVVTMADNASFAEDPLACLSENLDRASACRTRPADIGGKAWLENGNLGADDIVSMDAELCPDSTCYALSENTLLYRDRDHLTPEAVIRLAPAVADKLDKVIGSSGR